MSHAAPTPPTRAWWKDPATLAAVIGGIAAIVAAIFASSASDNTNKTSTSIAKLQEQGTAQQNEDTFLHNQRSTAYSTYIDDANKELISIKQLAGLTLADNKLRRLTKADTSALSSMQKTVVGGVTQVQLDGNEVSLIGSNAATTAAFNAKWDLLTLSSYLAKDFRAVSVPGISLADSSSFLNTQYCTYIGYYDGWIEDFSNAARADLGYSTFASPTPDPSPPMSSRLPTERPSTTASHSPTPTLTPPACQG